MRPLAVLVLVLGAIASLVFAITSILGDTTRGPFAEPDLIVRPVDAQFDPIDDPDLPLEVQAETAATQERTVVTSALGAGDRPENGALYALVVDEENQPVQGAKVALVYQPGGPSLISESVALMQDEDPPAPTRTAKTDAEGKAEFTGIAPGAEWSLVVTHQLYASEAVGPIAVPEGDGITEKITLKTGQAIFGFVVDADTGVALPGATLVIDSPLAAFLPSSRKSSARREVIAGPDGSYSFDNIGGGQRVLTVKAKGYATTVITNFSNEFHARLSRRPRTVGTGSKRQGRPIYPDGEGRKPLRWDFELPAGQVIAGVVLGPDRAGVAGVKISAMNQSGSVGSRGDTFSAENGEFLLEDLGEGAYSIHAEAAGFQTTPLQRIEAGSTNVEILLAKQGGVSGRIVDAETGKPVSAFNVKVRTLHPRNVSWGGVVGKRSIRDRSDGTFSIGGIDEGDYVVEAKARGFASSFSEGFRIDQGIQTTDIVVRLTKGGTVKGRVFDSYTNEPVVGAIVSTNDNNYVDSEIMSLLTSMGASATSKEKTTTNSEGEFELELLTPDTYQIQIEKPGYTAILLNDVAVADGPATEIGPFAMKKGAIVVGTVFAPGDAPVAGATVMMRPTSNDYFGTCRGRTDAEGRFTLRNAKAGTYSLSASRPSNSGANPFAPVLDIQHSEIEITIADGASYTHDLYLPQRKLN